MKNSVLLILALVLIVAGFSGLIFTNLNSSFFLSPISAIRFKSEGERIFFTGSSSKRVIPFEGGPIWLRRMGGGCASCHGEDGRGGIPIMMSSIVAPDITYDELQKEGMTTDDIKKAIVEGIHEEDESLSWIMPRWKMNDEELDTVIDFLKELSK